MKQCIFCGRELPEYAKFCDQCGQAVSLPEAEQIETDAAQTEETPLIEETAESAEEATAWEAVKAPRIKRRRWPWVALGCFCAVLVAVSLMLALRLPFENGKDATHTQIGAATPGEALERYWNGFKTGDAAQKYEALGVDYRAFLTTLIQSKFETPEKLLLDQIYFDIKRNSVFYDALGEWMVEEAAAFETIDDVAEFWVAFQGRMDLRYLQMQYGKDYSLRILDFEAHELSESDRRRQMNVFRNLAQKALEEGGVYCYAPEDIQEILEISFQIEERGSRGLDQSTTVVWYAVRTEFGWFLHKGLGNLDIWQELLQRSYPF